MKLKNKVLLIVFAFIILLFINSNNVFAEDFTDTNLLNAIAENEYFSTGNYNCVISCNDGSGYKIYIVPKNQRLYHDGIFIKTETTSNGFWYTAPENATSLTYRGIDGGAFRYYTSILYSTSNIYNDNTFTTFFFS